MEPTRIVFVDMPRMLREIIREIVARQADMDVVGDFAAPLPLRDAVVSCDALLCLQSGEDVARAIGSMASKVRPGGLLLIANRDQDPEFRVRQRGSPPLRPSRKYINTRPFGAQVGPSTRKSWVRRRSPERSGFITPI